MLEADGEHWLTYIEVAKLLGCTPSAARMHAKRRGWHRRSPNAIGGRALVLVPDALAVQPRATHVHPRAMHTGAPMSGEANGHDQANDEQAVAEAWSAAVMALSAALAAERDRVACAEQRIEELFAALADARAAERIAADSAAGLRHQLELLQARRAWWRRWFG